MFVPLVPVDQHSESPVLEEKEDGKQPLPVFPPLPLQRIGVHSKEKDSIWGTSGKKMVAQVQMLKCKALARLSEHMNWQTQSFVGLRVISSLEQRNVSHSRLS